jgi:alpha-glucosidase
VLTTDPSTGGGVVDATIVKQSAPWWQRAAIYQIYPLSFQDTDGDGKGDLAGVLSRVDYLKWLGVDAVWLGPVYVSPMADFGYDIADFTEVDRMFGSLADLDKLIEALHARDIRLILDFVPNHTSDQHPWFLESRSSRHNPKRDWYVWVDSRAGGGPPNNWLSRFGGSAWEWDPTTEQYYYHAFLKEQPDLNWRNPAVRAAMGDALRFWLRRGVDGFRVDAAAVLAEDEFLRDDPPNCEATEKTPPPERFKRLYTDARPEVLGWLAELRAVADEFQNRVLLAEVDTSPEWLAQFYGDKKRPIIHLPLNYRLLDTPWTAHEIARAVDAYYGSLPEQGWPCWVIGSHDKKRIASVIGAAQARVAAMLFLTLPGTAVFYSGDELAMVGGSVNSAEARDPFERHVPGYGLNRDPERTPMQWSAQRNSGFTNGTPWLPLGSNYSTHNVEVESAEPRSMLNLYRRLLALRAAEPALTMGGFSGALSNSQILTYSRRCNDETVLVALNFGDNPLPCDLASSLGAQILLSTYLDRGDHVGSEKILLRANEGLILKLNTGRAAI